MNRIIDIIKKNFKSITFISAPIISIIVSNIISTFGVKNEQCRMIGLTLLMIIWWMSLCIKIGITSLVPLILIPLLGIDSGSSIATSYFEDSIVTCFGSLLISDAVEYYNLHRKFANIFLLRANKYGFNGILASFLFCSGCLSMFLSNSATAALMTPLARAIVNEIKLSKISPEEINQITNLAKAIDISIAFAATVGGQATITGTGANLVLKGLMLEQFGEEGEVNYLTWLSIAFPLSIVNLFLLWIILYLYFLRNNSKGSILKEYNEDYHQIEMTCKSPIDDNNDNHEIIEQQIISNTSTNTNTNTNKSKNLSFPEFIVITIFLLMILLWITRDPPGKMGWGRLFWNSEYITDGTVAIFCAFCLLIIPSRPPNYQILYKFFDKPDTATSSEQHHWENILDFSAIGKHWEVLFLLGAGFALSRGFQKSGLEVTISDVVINNNETKSLISLISSASVSACAITNVMSNVAAANILLPAFICIGPRYVKPINPLLILYPITISVSLALCFPFGTPPNSIIMSNKNVDIKELAIVGFICTVIFLSTTLIFSSFVVPYMIENNINETIINACKL